MQMYDLTAITETQCAPATLSDSTLQRRAMELLKAMGFLSQPFSRSHLDSRPICRQLVQALIYQPGTHGLLLHGVLPALEDLVKPPRQPDEEAVHPVESLNFGQLSFISHRR